MTKKLTEPAPRTYRLSSDVHEELRRLREVHGSYNKALRVVLAVNGKLKEHKPPQSAKDR